jgi:hypothetical protein
MASGHKPGTKAPASGIYRPTKGGTEIALSRGRKFPPTKAGGTWVPTQLIPKKPK